MSTPRRSARLSASPPPSAPAPSLSALLAAAAEGDAGSTAARTPRTPRSAAARSATATPRRSARLSPVPVLAAEEEEAELEDDLQPEEPLEELADDDELPEEESAPAAASSSVTPPVSLSRRRKGAAASLSPPRASSARASPARIASGTSSHSSADEISTALALLPPAPLRRRSSRRVSLAQLPLLMLLLLPLALLLPLPDKPFTRRTYVDENALSPGSTRVEWTWQAVAWADDLATQIALLPESSEARAAFVQRTLVSYGLAADVQSYSLALPGHTSDGVSRSLRGTNAYGHLRAPRADGREAILLLAPWLSRARNPAPERSEGARTAAQADGGPRRNVRGIAAMLAWARWAGQFSNWSKDFIFVFPDGELEGTQAFISAYYGRAQSNLEAEPLQLPRAQIWNAVALDYPADSFSDLQLLFEGADGALPNLDALISLAHVAAHEDGVPVRLDAPRPDGQREDEARAALGWLGEQMERGSMGQGAALRYLQGVRNAATQIGRAAGGRPSGVHGLLHRYHIDAYTIYATPADGPYGFYNIGRVTEGVLRTYSNLLERLHHSQFFYLLTSPQRFIQLGTFLPVALVPSLAMTLRGLLLWASEGAAADQRAASLVARAGLPHPTDVPLARETAHEQLAGLVRGAIARGAVLGPQGVQQLRQALSRTSRPTFLALLAVLVAYALGGAVFMLASTMPLECARDGYFTCMPFVGSMGVLALSIILVPLLLSHLSTRTPADAASAPKAHDGSEAEAKSLRRLSLARTLHALTLLQAGMLIACVSVLNFPLALLTGIALAPALLTLAIPAGNGVGAARRVWLLVQAHVLLPILQPTFLLLDLDSVLEACHSGTLPALPSFLRPLLAIVELTPRGCAPADASRQLLAAGLRDWHVFGSATLPFLTLAYGPLLLQACFAATLAALA